MMALENKVPPPIVALLVVGAMWWVAGVTPRLDLAADWRLGLTFVLAAAGIIVSVAASIQFHRAHTTVNPLRPDSTTTLVTGGVYRFTRNPMYVGLLFALLAYAVYLAAPAALAGPVVFLVFVDRFQIAPEERAMARLFGAEFEAYRARVRRWV